MKNYKIKSEMDKNKIEIGTCQSRAENALFWERYAPFYKYKNREASPMGMGMRMGGHPSNKKKGSNKDRNEKLLEKRGKNRLK